MFLFCSDGLTTMLSDEEIRDMIAADDTKRSEDHCHALVDLANEKGGVDNITVVFVKVEELGPPPEVE
jgi:protein phosphatase